MRGIYKTSVVIAAFALVTAACDRGAPPTPIDENAVAARDDERLATFVQARYQTDSTIRANDIDVSAENGVVTLHGTVADERARAHAAEVAQQVDGVQSVNNQLQVDAARTGDATAATGRPVEGGSDATRTSAETRSPAWITTKIQAQYFVNPEVKPWNIDVTTGSNGVVTLRGEVDAAADREEAVRIARETEGVTRVENQLRVRGEQAEADTANREMDTTAKQANRAMDDPDGWITAKVQAKYFVDTDVKGLDIDVDTRDGVVTLTGQVESEAERRQAVAIARNTDGVASVNDQLKVQADSDAVQTRGSDTARKGPIEVDDMWITTKIQAQYFLDGDIKGRDINVDAREGVVYLKGTVESDAERQLAETIARQTDGVTRVENNLKVDTSARQ